MQGTASGWVPRKSVNYNLPDHIKVVRIIPSVDINGQGLYVYPVPPVESLMVRVPHHDPEHALRGPQGREPVESVERAGRTTERPVRKPRDSPREIIVSTKTYGLL